MGKNTRAREKTDAFLGVFFLLFPLRPAREQDQEKRWFCECERERPQTTIDRPLVGEEDGGGLGEGEERGGRNKRGDFSLAFVWGDRGREGESGGRKWRRRPPTTPHNKTQKSGNKHFADAADANATEENVCTDEKKDTLFWVAGRGGKNKSRPFSPETPWHAQQKALLLLAAMQSRLGACSSSFYP